MEEYNRNKIKTVKKNDFLLRQGKKLDAFYVIRKGRFRLSMMTVFGEYDAGIVKAGESIGELKIFDKSPLPFSMIAMEDCEVLEVSIESIEKQIKYLPLAIAKKEIVKQQKLESNINRISDLISTFNYFLISTNKEEIIS